MLPVCDWYKIGPSIWPTVDDLLITNAWWLVCQDSYPVRSLQVAADSSVITLVCPRT